MTTEQIEYYALLTEPDPLTLFLPVWAKQGEEYEIVDYMTWKERW